MNSTTRKCAVEGCNNPMGSPKEYCPSHYGKLKRNGSPLISKNERHGKTRTPEYRTWKLMRRRCHNPNDESYNNYGGRGIKVCDRWRNSFLAFYEDMGVRPKNKYTIERINNNGDYEPGNCIWLPQEIQGSNKRNNIFIEYEGEIRTMSEWSRVTGIPYGTLRERRQRGWTTERNFTTPPRIMHPRRGEL